MSYFHNERSVLSSDSVIITKNEFLAYKLLYGEVPPERGNFFRLQVCKRVGTSLVEEYEIVRTHGRACSQVKYAERVRKSAILGFERASFKNTVNCCT